MVKDHKKKHKFIDDSKAIKSHRGAPGGENKKFIQHTYLNSKQGKAALKSMNIQASSRKKHEHTSDYNQSVSQTSQFKKSNCDHNGNIQSHKVKTHRSTYDNESKSGMKASKDKAGTYKNKFI